MMPSSFTLLVQTLGFTVVHSLWQIALVWFVFKALTWRMQRHNNTTYLLALAAMLGSAVWAVATFSEQYQWLSAEAEVVFFEKSLSSETAYKTPVASSVATKTLPQNLLTMLRNWTEQYSATIGWVWLLCASLLWLRLSGGWWLAQRLKRQGISSPDESLQTLCGLWAKRLNINQTVRLLESANVSEPLTIGFWKPVILFPLGMLARLTPAQVEALLLHELAHIRRHDYLLNLFQLALEVCFFYHPMIWLLSWEARTRREYCCDDVVLRHTSNPLLYAKTLTNLQLSLFHNQNHFAMNATGNNYFTKRILRIAGITPKRSLRSNWLVFLFLALLIALSSWWPSVQMPLNLSEAASFNLVEPVRNSAKAAATITHSGPDAEAPNAQMAALLAGDTVAPGYIVAAAPLKMNVFYIGVDNPLRVAASGIPAGELSPRLIGAGTLTGSNGDYMVQVTQPGEVIIQVYRKQGKKETLLSELMYRVKRIPDPTPKLGGKFSSGTITKQKLIEMGGVEAVLENFLLDATCEVLWYELTVLPKNADPISRSIQGGQFSPESVSMINLLDSLGGAVFMDDIKIKCPGDASPRNVGGLAFKIKAVE